MGWILCLIFASLRFNDGVHVKPSSLEMKDNVLYGLCWQTKVDRKRRGTRFAIAAVGMMAPAELDDEGFVSEPWLIVWWRLFKMHAFSDRDFWMFELADLDTFTETEITYHRGLQCFRGAMASAAKKFGKPARKAHFAKLIPTLTWHSCRVTLLDAAVHAGVDALPISMQANHASTDLVVKYTRNRRQVPLQMVGRLLQDLRSQWAPQAAVVAGSAPAEDDQFSADDEAEVSPQYYMKRSKVANRVILTQKFHVTARDDLSQLACSRVQLEDCEPMGDALPDVSVLCIDCRKKRPDLWPIE